MLIIPQLITYFKQVHTLRIKPLMEEAEQGMEL